MSITPWVYLYFTNIQKQKTKHFPSPTFIFWGYILEWYFPRFLQKTKKCSFWANSVFSLSCKISFANLWSLFMERITYNYFKWTLLYLLMQHNVMQYDAARWNSGTTRSSSHRIEYVRNVMRPDAARWKSGALRSSLHCVVLHRVISSKYGRVHLK